MKAVGASPAASKSAFDNYVDFIGDTRVIFDIGGDKYRLIVRVSYTYKPCQVKFIGPYSEHGSIDPLTVEIR